MYFVKDVKPIKNYKLILTFTDDKAKLCIIYLYKA